MKNTRVQIRKLGVALLIAAALGFVSCESVSPLQDEFTLSGKYEINWSELPDIGSNLKLGGFTGLFYKGGRIFYTVTMRGPVVSMRNESEFSTYFLLPEFTPRIVKLELQDDNTMKIAGEIEIKNPLNERCSGKPTEDAWPDDEIITNGEEISDFWGIYPSGVFFDIDANLFYVSEQYSPSVLQVTSRGNWFMRVSPGEGFRFAYENQTCNGGISGIDLMPNGDFLVALARSLEHNRNVNDPDQTRPINYALRRIGIYDPDTRSDISMFYFVEPANAEGDERFTLLGDIEFVNDTTYLITEISKEENTAVLFEAVVTDSTSKVQEGLEGINGKTFETLSAEEWRENGLNPLKKIYVMNLADYGFKNPGGIEIIDEKHIAVIENNNFGIINGNPETGEYELDKTPVKLEILELPITLELQ